MSKVCASMTGLRDGFMEGVCFNDRIEGWLCRRCVLQRQDRGMVMWKVCASMTGWRDGYVEGVCFNDRMEGWLCGRCVLQRQDGEWL